MLLHEFVHRVPIGRRSQFGEPAAGLPVRKVGPQYHPLSHRVTCREFGESLQEVIFQEWQLLSRRLASPAFFRPRLGAASSVRSSSIKPRRTVFGSIPNNPETYSIPPRSSLVELYFHEKH